MGYTSVKDRSAVVRRSEELAATPPAAAGWDRAMPLVVDQTMAEAGVYEPAVAALALEQASGDVARAVSLIRPWSSVMPRLGTSHSDLDALQVERRITPGFAAPPGGQYLGASLDYAQRLLLLGGQKNESTMAASPGAEPAAQTPSRLPRALAGLTSSGLVAGAAPPAESADITRSADRSSRGALLQLLSRAETGALTALAYTAIRGYSALQDPTLAELRGGRLPVRVRRPDGEEFDIGEVPVTTAEMVLYRMHGEKPDPRLTLGFGATLGRLERRAIAAALLDGACSRAATAPSAARRDPCEDAEFLAIALDGPEATGFVEHLKLPHHVTFASELDRLRSARRAGDLEE